METDSREGIVKETAEAKSDGRRINEADFQLERKGAQSRADPVDDKPVSDAASRRKKQMVQKGVRDGNGFNEAVVNDGGFSRKLQDHTKDSVNRDDYLLVMKAEEWLGDPELDLETKQRPVLPELLV